MWLARQLEPEAFGQWNFAIASLFAGMAETGREGVVQRELVQMSADESCTPNTSAAGAAALTALCEKHQQEATRCGAGRRSDYIDLYREYKYRESLFDLSSRRYGFARVDESREEPLIHVLDAATRSEQRSSPRRPLIAVVSPGGTAIVLALIFLLSVRSAPRRPRATPVVP